MMVESVSGQNFAQLFWLVCSMFAMGAVAGIIIPVVGRTLRFGEVRARALGMKVSLAFAFISGLVVAVEAARYLMSRSNLIGGNQAGSVSATIWSGLSVAGIDLPKFNLILYADPLTALFAVLVGFFTCCIAVYSFGWLAEDPQCHSVASGFNLFAATTVFVIVVDNAFWLLLSLELLSLASAFLVLYKGKAGGTHKESKTAIQVYLIVTHVSIMCIGAAILVLGINHGSLDFNVFRNAPLANSKLTSVVYLLTLVGLGLRAGMTPFHAWVPIVHPQLPTNTHAMMSGVMLKIAIYLMIRFFFEFLNPIAWWWGALLLLLAGLTSLINVFYALLSTNLKKALAYHSVENIGIILAGVGLALLFASEELGKIPGMSGVTAVALIASLYHVVNHAIFKTLLFLGAASIENRTGTVSIDKLGGLLRRFRWTGTSFLVGAIAIAGFPPFNGFISEWLTLQAFFAGMEAYRSKGLIPLVLMVVMSMSLILLAAAFAMTALAFVKISGEMLLGMPRNKEVAANTKSKEVPWSMRGILGLLSVLCLLLGLLPGSLIPWLRAAAHGIGYGASALNAGHTSITIAVQRGTHQLPYTATLAILPAATLVVLPLLAVLIAVVWHALKPPRVSSIWIGGERHQPQSMQYTGSALSSLLWGPLVRSPSKRIADKPLPTNFFISKQRVVAENLNRFYNHAAHVVIRSSTWVGEYLQNGDIRRYLLFIFAIFMFVMILLVTLR